MKEDRYPDKNGIIYPDIRKLTNLKETKQGDEFPYPSVCADHE